MLMVEDWSECRSIGMHHDDRAFGVTGTDKGTSEWTRVGWKIAQQTNTDRDLLLAQHELSLPNYLVTHLAVGQSEDAVRMGSCGSSLLLLLRSLLLLIVRRWFNWI